MAEGKRKPFAERSLIPSRLRTGKTGRKSPRKKRSEQYSPAVRVQPTTGQKSYEPGSIPEYRRPATTQMS